MVKALRTLLLTTTFALASAAQAQTLWTKAEYGMTEGQVKSTFPDVVTAAKPDHLYGGAVGTLVLPGIEVAGHSFHATFYFVSNKLTQVTLSLDDRAMFDTILITYKGVEEILRAKYGPEIQQQISRGNLNVAEASWLSGKTNINLFASGVSGDKASLNINYQVRLAKEAEKL